MHEMYYRNIKKFQKMGMKDSDMQFIVRQKYLADFPEREGRDNPSVMINITLNQFYPKEYFRWNQGILHLHEWLPLFQ